ncbi:MAG: esterase/lipase family protein [Terriglobia bacterium]
MNIVLVHGILGFREKFGIEYFAGVAEHLRELPAKVYAAEVSPTGSVETRGEGLRSQILAALANGTLDSAEKIHIIAHSMGGVDSRYLLSPANEATTPANDVSPRVASLTTISSPHRGSPIADLVELKFGEEPAASGVLVEVVKALKKGVGEAMGHLGLSLDAVRDLTTTAMQDFNQRYLDNPGVRYFSVAGAGRQGTRATALALVLLYRYIQTRTGESNDGIVTVSSARWGAFDPNTWPCDHLEEAGHDLDHPFEPTRFNYLERYDQIVRTILALGAGGAFAARG